MSAPILATAGAARTRPTTAAQASPALGFQTSCLLDGQHVDGVIGGIQLGYNWQASNIWVYGLETDFQGSGERGNGNFGANYFFDFPAGFSALNASVTTKIL
jgi:hypothetical protein